MPTYAYACKDCHYAFDTVQSFSESSLTECPQCAGRLRKKFGNIGVTFKGSGFYRTDSRSSSSAGDGGSSSGSTGAGAEKAASSSSSSSADSGKSAAKTPAAASS